MMPQKCHNGGVTEVLRDDICDILSKAVNGMLQTKGEPHGDVMAMYFFPRKGLEALVNGKAVIRQCGMLLRNLHVDRDKMLTHVRQGYSCMTELVVYMVQELGYGGRRAHRICATLVRIARDRNLPAPKLTGEMLDEAARECEEEPPGLSTDVLQSCLDPVTFIETHNNIGGPAPSETVRMVNERRSEIADARKRQQDRIRRIAEGSELLQAEITAIYAGQ